MDDNPNDLTLAIQRIAGELRELEKRLKSEAAPDRMALNDFRNAVDNIRLTGWSVSELMNAQHFKKDPNTVMAFLSAERLRRFHQLVKNLCSDIERGLITVETAGMHPLCESVDTLQQRLMQSLKQRESYKMKDAAS